jgi:hypothetical protein
MGLHGIHGKIDCCNCGSKYLVWVVFFYRRGAGHSCDRATFDVYVNVARDGMTLAGSINLNNGTVDRSVYGGEFETEDVASIISIELRPSPGNTNPHNNITTFMLISQRRSDRKYAVIENAGMSDRWEYNLDELDYIYSFAEFVRNGEEVSVNKR